MAEELDEFGEQGKVVAVYVVPTGDELELDALTGQTELQLSDVADFDERGGQVQINETIYPYITVDDELSILTLATGLVEDVPMDTKVFLYPFSNEKWAMVQVVDIEEPVDARVPHQLSDLFEEEVRDLANQESVAMVLEGGDWVIRDVIGKEPSIDGAYIRPETLPIPDLTSDGIPPIIPTGWTPVLKPLGVGGLQAEWSAIENPDLVTYEVFLAEAAPVTVFDASTKIGETTGTRMAISTLPTGPLLKQVDYYLAVRVFDADDYATGEGTGGPTRVREADQELISSEWIYGNSIEAVQIRSGLLDADLVLAKSLSVGLITIDPVTGITIPLATGGDISFPADGSPASITADLVAKSIEIMGSLNIRGQDNFISGDLVAAAGVGTPSTPPVMYQDWPTYDISNIAVGDHPFRQLWSTSAHFMPCAPGAGSGGQPAEELLEVIRLYQVSSVWTIDIYEWNQRTGVTTTRAAAINLNGVNAAYFYDCQMYYESTTGQYRYALMFVVNGDVTLNIYDQAWGFVRTVTTLRTAFPGKTNTGAPALGPWEKDPGPYIAVSWSDGTNHRIARIDCTTGTLSGAVTCSGRSGGLSAYNPDWVWVWPNGYFTLWSDQLLSRERLTYTNTGVYNTTATNQIPKATTIPSGTGSIILGQTNWSGKSGSGGDGFIELDTSNKVYAVYCDPVEGYPNPQYGKYTWYDSDPGGVGVGESLPSPASAKVQPVRGSFIRVTFPQPPDDGTVDGADSAGIYVSTTNAAGSYLRWGYSSPGETAVYLASYLLGGSGVLPLTSDFDARQGILGRLRSIKGDTAGRIWELKGDGSGRVGPFAWDSNGANLGDTGWITATLENGWVTYGSPYAAPGYRRVNGIVYLKGLVKNGTDYPIFTLPPGFRPAEAHICAATQQESQSGIDMTAADANSGASDHHHDTTNGSIRVDVSSSGLVTYQGKGHGSGWISISGISFPADQ